MYLLLLCQICYINSKSRGNALAPNMRNSVLCTVMTFRQRSCNQRVGCLQWFGSRSFGPDKRSGPRLLSTVPWFVCMKNFEWQQFFLKNENIIYKSEFNMNKIYIKSLALEYILSATLSCLKEVKTKINYNNFESTMYS